MAKLIDAEEMFRCETCYHNSLSGCGLGSFGCDHGEMYRPSMHKLKVVDAVPVVRCKNCERAELDCLFGGYWCSGHRVNPDDFCSYGERKEE